MINKYLIAVAYKGGISSMVATNESNLFPYTESVLDEFRKSAISHTQDDGTFILSITHLGEFEE